MLAKIILRFCILIALYFTSLVLVFSYDSDLLQKNCLNNSDMLVDVNIQEWKRSTGLYGNSLASDIDACTDALMLTRNARLEPEQINYCTQSVQSRFGFPFTIAEKINNNPFQRAMYMNGYGRYWHGYNVILRPLLAVWDYVGIRYFFLFVFTLLSFAVFERMRADLGRLCAYLFVLGLIVCKYPVITACLQFLNMYILMLGLLLYLGYVFIPKYKSNIVKGEHTSLYMLCLTIGSLSCFFDLLTTPLLPIGMCLSYLIIYLQRTYNYTLSKLVGVKLLVIWACSYLGTWLVKWLLYSVICSDNIIGAGFKQIWFRSSGNAFSDYGQPIEINRLYAVVLNFVTLLMPMSYKLGVILAATILLGIILLALKYKNKQANIALQEQLLMLAGAPYIWYFLVANHSQLHLWFTYRSQMVTVLCLGYYLSTLIDWQQLLTLKKD